MKPPVNLEALNVENLGVSIGAAYPSLGFIPLRDAELGNGDYYGLYWPYGREDREPIICDMLHDEWSLEVAFSSSVIFKKWLDLNDGFRGDEEVDDPDLVSIRYRLIKPLLKNRPEEAVQLLEPICNDFPESSEYWFALATQFRRVGNSLESMKAAVRAFASNWIFGSPPNGLLRLLKNAKGQLDDPIINQADKLFMKIGEEENSNYLILKSVIDEYLSSETPTLGLILNQNYAYLMMMETNSCRERYNFNIDEWLESHQALCQKLLGDDRTRCS